VAELWEWLTWLRGRSSLLRTTSWTLTQVGLEVSKVEVTFRILEGTQKWTLLGSKVVPRRACFWFLHFVRCAEALAAICTKC